MNSANLTLIVPMILLTAIVMTPVTVTEDSFARYERHTGDVSQAASVRNSCLKPVSNSNTNDNMISNGNCGGTLSQQGGSGQSSNPTTVQSANPNIEVQRATTNTQNPSSPAPTSSTFNLNLNITCDDDAMANDPGCPNTIPSFLLQPQILTPAINSSTGTFSVHSGKFTFPLFPSPPKTYQITFFAPLVDHPFAPNSPPLVVPSRAESSSPSCSAFYDKIKVTITGSLTGDCNVNLIYTAPMAPP